MDSKVLFEDNVNRIKEYLKVYPEDINILSYNDITPLMKAVFYERVDVIDCLIEHGCDINFQNNDGWTALHYACYNKNNRDIIERLISNGASGLLKEKWGCTSLHCAAIDPKDVNIIHQLLVVSDPNALDDCGRSPFMVACWNKNIDIMSALINVTSDINAQDIHGHSPLDYCCIRRDYKGLRFLLSFGADVSIKDNRGRPPCNLRDEECKRIINEYLASRN